MLDIEPLLLKIKNRRPVVIAVPIIAGLLVGSLLVVKPGLDRLNVIKGEVVGLQQKVSAYQFVLDSESRTAGYKTRFSGDKTWLIEQVNMNAQKTGLSILSIFPEDQKKIGEYLDRTAVRIEAEADYHQLGEFVSRLESLDPYVKILGLDINGEKSMAASTNIATPGMPWQPGAVAAPRERVPARVYMISVSIGLFTPAAGAL